MHLEVSFIVNKTFVNFYIFCTDLIIVLLSFNVVRFDNPCLAKMLASINILVQL